jgi:hypothetical protein
MEKEAAITNPSPDEAKDALASVETMQNAALRRGLYPRWFSAAVASWAGALGVSSGVGSPLFLPILLLGVLAVFLVRRRTGAPIREIRSRGEFWVVMALGLGVGIVFVAGATGRDFGLAWAPYAAGALVTAAIFVISEIANEPARKRLCADAPK